MEKDSLLYSNRSLLQLIWPLLIEQLLNILVGMIDVVMVSSLGEAAVSGVSLVDSINNLLIGVLAALTAGGTVVCSQYMGMKQSERAGKAAGQLVALTVGGCILVAGGMLLGRHRLLSALFGSVEPDVMANAYTYFVLTTLSFPFLALYNSCAAIFRSMNNSRISMNISMMMNGINVVGNALCIYGLKMGVAGVAIPTLVARAAAAMVLFVLMQQPHNAVRLRSAGDLLPNRAMIREILAIGVPAGLENGIFHVGKISVQSLVSTLETHAIAGFAIANNVVMFQYLPGNALGLAMTTIVGQCIGAAKPEQAKQFTRKLMAIEYGLLAVLVSAIAVGRAPILRLYGLTDEAYFYANQLIVDHCFAMLIWPWGFLLPNALRAAHDATFTMLSSVVSMWIFRVGLAYLFVSVLGYSVRFVWFAMYSDWAFRALLFSLRFLGFTDRIRKIQLS